MLIIIILINFFYSIFFFKLIIITVITISKIKSKCLQNGDSIIILQSHTNILRQRKISDNLNKAVLSYSDLKTKVASLPNEPKVSIPM